MASNVFEFIIETTTKEYGSLESVDNCDDCEKNPGHEQFYSLDNLTADVLPFGCRSDQWLNYIRAWSERTVKITVTRPNANGQLFGTGCVYYNNPDKFYIVTNEHVIGCQEDVSNCKVEWFYNTEDRAGVETSCGVELGWCDEKQDLCFFTVTNIPETVKQLLLHPPDTPPDTDLEHIIAIAHPHGAPKTVTFGKYLGDEYVDGVGYRFIHTARTCGGCSGTRLIYTWNVNSLVDWQDGWLTHYAGRSGNVVYNIKDWRDGTVIGEVTSDTNNINYSVLGYWM